MCSLQVVACDWNGGLAVVVVGGGGVVRSLAALTLYIIFLNRARRSSQRIVEAIQPSHALVRVAVSVEQQCVHVVM